MRPLLALVAVAVAGRRLRLHHRRGPARRRGDAAARLHAERRPLGPLHGDGARVRRRRGRRAGDPQAGRVDRRAEAAAGRPGRHGDPRHPRPRPRPPGGPRHRRRHGVRPAAARGRARAAVDPLARRPRGRARRRQRPAVGRGGPALRRRGRRRRPRPGAHDDDRVPGRQGAARAPRGGGNRVLERRGRRAARASARRSASSASTSSAPRATPSWCCA